MNHVNANPQDDVLKNQFILKDFCPANKQIDGWDNRQESERKRETR